MGQNKTNGCNQLHLPVDQRIQIDFFFINQRVTNRISFTVDVATSKYRMYPLLGITAHWTDEDWIQREIGLCLSPLDGPHSGENIRDAFVHEIDERFSLLNKVNYYTIDDFLLLKK